MQAFYESTQFEALRCRQVKRAPIGPSITFSASDPIARDELFSDFDKTSPERFGILHGEYLLLEDGLIMIDRKGVVTWVSVGLEDFSAARGLSELCHTPAMRAHIRDLLALWDRFPVAHDVPVLSDPYVANYFHFSLELVPRLRFLVGGFHAGVVMPGSCLQRPFQQDLLARTIGGRHCILLPTPLRIRDPILAHDTLCHEGISWLRRASGIGASPGGRRIYIRRSGRGTRSAEGGGISEPPGFTALLRDFCFETIEFGNGDLGVAAQVALLDGAGLILAAHGAALTNLAYLGPEVSVLEVIGIGAPRACFMQIAATIGCRYHGFYSPIVDSQRNIVMDLDELRDAFHDRMPRPLAQA